MWAVSTSKLLSVPFLTDNSPLVHHEPSNSNEESGSNRTGNHKDTDPSNDFEEVVWAGNPIESESLWNAALGGSSWAEVRENNVRVEVGKLAVNVGRETGPNEVLSPLWQCLHLGSGSRVWCKNPV